jgi:hypothetical protein
MPIITAVALALPGTAVAAQVTVSGSVSGGGLSVTASAPSTFAADVDGGDSTPTYTIPLTTQATGTGAGWHETITSTRFSTGGTDAHVLAADTSSVTGVVETEAAGTNTPPANAVAYPVTVPAGAVAPAPIKFFDAAASTGMGRFVITPTVAVFVPQDAYAGTYTSDVTVALAAGP